MTDHHPMQDIIITIPWHCGFSDDCHVGWHSATYWTDGEGGYTFDNYSDGDHEWCDEESVPTNDEVIAAWQQYHTDVAKTGADPLNEFHVPLSVDRRRTWQVRFRNSILGAVFTGARRRGRGEWITNPAELPTELYDYLVLVPASPTAAKPNWVFEGLSKSGEPSKFDLLEELVDEDENCRKQHRHHGLELKFLVTIDERTPRAEHAIRRDKVRAARAAKAESNRRRWTRVR